MDFIFWILTALIFYFLGAYRGQEKKMIDEARKVITRQKVKAGIIPYPTPQEMKFRGSEEEKIEAEWDKNFQGKI